MIDHTRNANFEMRNAKWPVIPHFEFRISQSEESD